MKKIYLSSYVFLVKCLECLEEGWTQDILLLHCSPLSWTWGLLLLFFSFSFPLIYIFIYFLCFSSGICKFKPDSQLPDSWQSHMHPVMVKAFNNFGECETKIGFREGVCVGGGGGQFGGWGQGGEGGGLTATALQVGKEAGLTGAKCTLPDQENKNKLQNKREKTHA